MTAPRTRTAGDVRSSYAEPATLRSRGGIYSFRRGATDLRAVVVRVLDSRPGDRLLDLGCGEAPYLDAATETSELGLVACLDTSVEMLGRARQRRCRPVALQATLEALPLRPAAWDRVLAAHSLYHSDDPHRVLRRLPTLLRPGGRLCVVLNGPDHLEELRAAARAAGHPGLLGESDRLTADEAVLVLAADGHDVEVVTLRDTLVIPEPGPALSYVASTRRIYEPHLPAGLTWLEMMTRLESQLHTSAGRGGAFEVRTHTAVLRCS